MFEPAQRATAFVILRCRPLRGLNYFLLLVILGLAPQALCCRPLRGLHAVAAARAYNP